MQDKNVPRNSREWASVLSHEDMERRLEAVQALEMAGSSDAVTALITALEDPVEQVRQQAAGALGRMGDPIARDALVRLAQDSGQTPRTRAIVVDALDKLSGPSVNGRTDALPEQAAPLKRSEESPAISRLELGFGAGHTLSLIAEKGLGESVAEMSADGQRLQFVTRQDLTLLEISKVQSAIEQGHVQIGHYLALMPSYPVFVLRGWIYDNDDNPFWIDAYPDIAGPGRNALKYIADGGVIRVCLYVFNAAGVPLFSAGCQIDTQHNHELAASIAKAEFHLQNSLEEEADFNKAVQRFQKQVSVEARHFFLLERRKTERDPQPEPRPESVGDPASEGVRAVQPMEMMHYALLRYPLSTLRQAAPRQRILIEVPLGRVSDLTDGFTILKERVKRVQEVEIEPWQIAWAINLKKAIEEGISVDIGNPWVAKEYWLSAHELAPAYPLVLMNLGVIQALCGEGEEAVRLLEQAMFLAPDNERIQKNLQSVRRKFNL